MLHSKSASLILLFKYIRSIRFLLFLLFVILFVIQFKSGPFNYMPTNYYHYRGQINNDNSNNNQSQSQSSSSSSSSSETFEIHTIINDDLFASKMKINTSSSTTDNQTGSIDSQKMNSIIMQQKQQSSLSSSNINDKIIINSITLINSSTLPNCPLVPPNLVGRLKVLINPPPMEELETMFPQVEIGGRFRPKQCHSNSRVAIIVPYRDREFHLRTFLLNIHPMLMRQNIDYGVYIVEQLGNKSFNRAKLMNVGFLEASKQYPYDCFIFHDVDLIPEDDRNLYTCPEQPRHMSVAIDKFRYRLPYKDIFGGVSALNKEQFIKINGFSNEFWGWGGEDDDMSNRIRHYGYKISRYSNDIARYKMLKHKNTSPNAERFKKLYNGWRRFKTDGINNIHYDIVDLVFKKLYTWISVELYAPIDDNHNKKHSSG
nr:beta-1,4-N-acetylgalactosaminyltransferase bre-4-like [Dermatophagoides farinae]